MNPQIEKLKKDVASLKKSTQAAIDKLNHLINQIEIGDAPRAYEPWGDDEKEALKKSLDLFIEARMRTHGRSNGAIKSAILRILEAQRYNK